MRERSSYRGARRNRCLREKPKSTWGPRWHHPDFKSRFVPPFTRYGRRSLFGGW
jgi:hypothetical protein